MGHGQKDLDRNRFNLCRGRIGSLATGGGKPMKLTPAKYNPTIVQMAVKANLRDPDSAQFGDMTAYDDRKLNGAAVVVVCGSVNAKNGFGGYSGFKNFLFIEKPLTV